MTLDSHWCNFQHSDERGVHTCGRAATCWFCLESGHLAARCEWHGRDLKHAGSREMTRDEFVVATIQSQ